MDLNQALNLNMPNSDNMDFQKSQLNNNFNDRIFAINPMTLKYDNRNNNFQNSQRQQLISPSPHQARSSLPAQSMQTAYPVSFEKQGVHGGLPQFEQKTCIDYSSMSPSYLQMKHSQEMQSSMENPNFNLAAIDKLKQDQANQLQHNLSHQQTNQCGPIGVNSLTGYQYAQANHLKPDDTKKTYAYNTQGEAVTDSTTLYQDQYNRYKLLKEMSPEMLNQLYGRQSDQAIIVNNLEAPQGDIYEQTSCYKTPHWDQTQSQELKSQLEQRQNEILKQKSKYGIQSYNNSNYGTNLNEAFFTNQS